MARLIPNILDRGDTPSPGEKLLFDFLKHAPGTEDWVVFHSQRLAYVKGKPQGEADFVVCVPEYGVLVVEVKGHRFISRNEGQWLYGLEQTPGKDPFKQASDAMHALMKSFNTRAPHLDGQVLFSSAVVFTHVDTIPPTDEWRASEVIDATAMTPEALSIAIRNSLTSAAKHLKATTGFVPSDDAGSPLSPLYMEALEEVLRPRFEAVLQPSTLKKLHEEELLRLTSEQYAALDEMINNDRVVFEGPAGTGKTLLAIEAARRAVDSGERVLLVCHNRGLAKYLKDSLKDREGESIFVGTLHSYLMRLTGLELRELEVSPKAFYQEELPEAALDILTKDVSSGGFNPESDGFDTIIIDELQDLLLDSYLEIIPQLMRRRPGGEGKIFAFGDIENQAFFENRDATAIRRTLKKSFGGCTFRNLTVNCRNTPETVELVNALVEVRPPYSAVRPRFDKFKPEFKTFSKDPELELVKVLSALDDKGYVQTGVTVLSLAAERDSSAARVADPAWVHRLKPYSEAQNKKSVPYTSVYQFKGLESPIVVLTDIKTKDLVDNLEALYVGITRATLMTILIVDKSTANDIATRVAEMLLNRAGGG